MENHEINTTAAACPAVNALPGWFDRKTGINEPQFCEFFLLRHSMIYNAPHFYDTEGPVNEQLLKKEISEHIAPFVHHRVALTVNNLLDALTIFSPHQEIELSEAYVNVGNGTYYLNGTFIEEKKICMNRIPVNYNPNAPVPTLWLKFLSQLIHEDDIPMLQEFIGYLLIPSTKAQKMLVLQGAGGEGKSVLGYIIGKLLGSNMSRTSIQKLCTNRFAKADQCGKLLMLDDDMKMDALQDTDLLKSLITSTGFADVERKGRQSTLEAMFARFMVMGNGNISSLYDRSDGFYRRQWIIRVLSRDPDRVDDPYLAEKIAEELEGILLWALEGLERLVANNFQFTASARAEKLLAEARREQNNVIDFLESTGYIRFAPDASEAVRELYGAYECWCRDNADSPSSVKSFGTRLGNAAQKYGMVYDKNLHDGSGKYVRGYHGIETTLSY